MGYRPSCGWLTSRMCRPAAPGPRAGAYFPGGMSRAAAHLYGFLERVPLADARAPLPPCMGCGAVASGAPPGSVLASSWGQGDMKKERVLITVKTYPTLSRKYGETVCTAGVREEGSWVRIYPVPFRRLDEAEQYKKFDWIECRLIRNSSDPRPETFRLPRDDAAVPLRRPQPVGDHRSLAGPPRATTWAIHLARRESS